MDLRGHARGRYFQLVAAGCQPVRRDAVGIAHVAIADVLRHGVAIAATGEPADLLSIPKDRLAAEQDKGGIVDCEAGEALLKRLACLFREGLAAEERRVLLQLYRPGHA